MSKNLPTKVGLTCYETKLRLLEYVAPIWGGLPQYLTDKLESIQTRSLKILGLPSDSLQSLEQHWDNLAIREYKKIMNDETHPCRKYIPDVVTNTYDLRTPKTLPQFFSYTRHELIIYSQNKLAIVDNIFIGIPKLFICTYNF